MTNGSSSSKRPQWSWTTKEEEKQLKFQEYVMHVHAKAIVNMAIEIFMKTTISGGLKHNESYS